jgi:hypothetical protein
LAHNSGHKKATYWLGDGTDLMQSQKFISVAHLNEIWNTWCDDADSRYNSVPGRKRKLGTDAVRLEEGMLVLGTDVIDLPKKDIKKIIKSFISKFEKDNNTKIRHWSYHDHEGHKDNDIEKINRHIHFIFDNVSKSGEMVRRKWKRSYLKQLQDDIYTSAKAVVPEIERATNYEALGQKAPKQKHHKQWRIEKENKKIHKNEIYLKEQMKILRTELQAQGGARADYAKLEQLNKDLKAQLEEQRDSTDKRVNQAQVLLSTERLKFNDLEKRLSKARETILVQKTTISSQKIEIELLEQSIELLEAKNKANFGMNTKIKAELISKQELLNKIHQDLTNNYTLNGVDDVMELIKENVYSDDDIQSVTESKRNSSIYSH